MRHIYIVAILFLGACICRANVTMPADGEILSKGFAVQVRFADTIPKVSVPPTPIDQPFPTYPIQLRRATIEGFAVLRISVGIDGSTSEVMIVKQSDKLFGDAASLAAKHWKFSPAEEPRGKPAATTIEYKILFLLLDSDFYPDDTHDFWTPKKEPGKR